MPEKKQVTEIVNTRESWIDYAKGIAIILVVYWHVAGGFLLSNSGSSYPVLSFTRNLVLIFAMPLFFFLAGLFTEQSLERRGLKDFIINKSKNLIYPYLVWSLMQGEIEVIFSNYLSFKVTQSDILAILYHPRAQFWFLYSLFLSYLFYALISGLIKYSRELAIGISIILYFFPVKIGMFGLHEFSLHFIFFMAGVFYNKIHFDKRIVNFSSLVSVLLITAFYALLIALRFLNSEYIYSLPNIFVSLITITLSAFGIISLMMISKYIAGKNIFKILLSAGFYSMPIYLAHGIFGSGCRVLLDKIAGMDNAALLIIPGMLGGIFIPVFLYKYTMKFGFPYLFELPGKKSGGSS